MALLQIRDIWTDLVIFEVDGPGISLSDADLSGAYLSGAYLSRAYLSRANLSGADLSGADLSGADLSGAYLFRADLSGANLNGANLSGADLSGADLSGATWRIGVTLRRSPLFLTGFRWPVTILDDHMQIGCQFHSLADWALFEDAQIAAMDCQYALSFWQEKKLALLALARADNRGVNLQEPESTN